MSSYEQYHPALFTLSFAPGTYHEQTDTAKLATTTNPSTLIDWINSGASYVSQMTNHFEQVHTFMKVMETPNEERQICSICMEDKVDRELPCGHQHCKGCIVLWLMHASTCPLCRKEFNEETQVFPTRIAKRVMDFHDGKYELT